MQNDKKITVNAGDVLDTSEPQTLGLFSKEVALTWNVDCTLGEVKKCKDEEKRRK